jgi:hypothetical protein
MCDILNCQNKYMNSEKADNKYGKIKSFEVECFKCHKTFVVNEREKQFPKRDRYFCCRGCANYRNHTEETKEKTRKSLREYRERNGRKISTRTSK